MPQNAVDPCVLDWDGEAAPTANQSRAITRALATLRKHLRMDLAFISEFGEESRSFRFVDTDLESPPLRAGDELPLDDGYCLKVVEGCLPNLIPDTQSNSEALKIPATDAVPIGSHISVPLYRECGSIYGTLCCFNLLAQPTLSEQHLDVMRAFAELIGQLIDSESRQGLDLADKRRRINSALQSDDPEIVFQPIYRLADMSLMGSEALSRFSHIPLQSPDKWFADAGEAGMRADLELKAITKALQIFSPNWQTHTVDLTLNCSPQTIREGRLASVLQPWPAERLVIEITEHDQIDDYVHLATALSPLRARGVRIAVDDAGSGFASMRHILTIGPDIIKLDVSLTRDIDKNTRKRALAAAFVTFGRETGSKIVGEGVETAGELCALKNLGVDKAQGYYLDLPMNAASFASLLSTKGAKRLS